MRKSRVAAIFFLLGLQAGLCVAGVDQSWKEPVDGGGSLPAVAAFFGLAGAVWMGGSSLLDNGQIGNALVAAFLGFTFGTMLGLPVACITR